MNEPEPPRPRTKRHHRWRWIVAGVVVLVLVAAVAFVALRLLFRDTAEPVSVAEASRRFRREHPDAHGGEGPLTPAEGVYLYRGKGTDRLSIFSLEETQGPTMPATVTHDHDDCWTLRIDFNDKHWQSWQYCVGDDGQSLDEAAGETFQSWNLGVTTIDNLTDSTCDAPELRAGMEPGDSWEQRCTVTNDQVSGQTVSEGPIRYLGTVEVEVGDDTVTAFHFRRRRDLTGSQTGTEHTELWIAPNGMPVRTKRRIELTSGSPVGNITYHEDTQYRLTSLTPQS